MIVSDDRAELCNPQVIPDADEYLVVHARDIAKSAIIHRRTYIAAVTRGFPLDVEMLPGLLETPAPYIGVMGSRRRWATAAKKLRDPSEGDGATGSEYLFQVDFQSDHVEQQDQSQLRDRGDGFVVFNESDADRSHQKTGDQISENHRLFEDLRRHREQPRGDDANGDVR